MQLKGELEENLWFDMFKSEKQKGLKFYELSILLAQLVKEQQNKPREGKSNKIIVVWLEFNEIQNKHNLRDQNQKLRQNRQISNIIN